MCIGSHHVPLVLTERQREILAGNRLKVVVAQVKFPPIHALNSAQGVADFQNAILDRFPIAEQRTKQVTVRVSEVGVESDGGQLGPWRFTSAEGNWILALAADSLSLETTSYRDYDAFRERAREALSSLVTVVRPARLDRFGLRFVNELAFPDVRTTADWRRFIGEDLLSLAGSGELSERVTFALQQINMELDEGKIIFKHGYAPRPEGGDAPSVYVVDIDTFDDRPGTFDIDAIVGKMNTYNEWAWNLFRANVRDELVDLLREGAE